MLKDGVDGVDGLDAARSVTLSSDGSHAYVAGYNDNAVSWFERNASTGALSYFSEAIDWHARRPMRVPSSPWSPATPMEADPSSRCTPPVLNPSIHPLPEMSPFLEHPEVGQTLKVSNTLVDPDGLGTITYRWYRDGQPIVYGGTLF